MPSDTSQRKATKQIQPGAPPPEPEHLPCPRCDSTNTKFCYYNNYNFSQPRHFCKACRRYWTHGGTLRDVPVGGGSRKNAKRSRTTNTLTTPSTHDYSHISTTPSPVLSSFAVEHGGAMPMPSFMSDVKSGLNMCGSFTSFLNTQGPAGLFAVGGYGPGMEDMAFGLGRSVWPFPGAVLGGPAGGDAGANVLGNTWQLESGHGGFVG